MTHPYNEPIQPSTEGPCPVDDYIIGLKTSRVLSRFRRYLSVDNLEKTPTQHMSSISYVLRPLRPLLKKAKDFQSNYVNSWNPSVSYPTSMIYLPLSQHDEVSRDGCLQVIVELLHDFGLLKKSHRKGHYDLAPGAEKRLIFLSGDCLSMDNLRHQQNRVRRQLTHPGNAAFVHNIMQAMNCIREGVGDLHVHMHMLTVIYIFFYPAFLQTCQAVLLWKRIQLNPLKRYQNSKALVKIVYEELERLRLETWAESIKVEDGSTEGTLLQIPTHLLRYSDIQEE
eukprot:scaffold113168_cov100-Attheya_sp.AAC.1